MLAREKNPAGNNDIWADLAAPLPAGVIAWRQDGRPVTRDGKYIARFVAYIEANTVRERLDAIVPGEWDLTLELLPTLPQDADEDPACSFKARLQVLGVIREDVGHGRDYKQAATDAFKRAAVRFGVGHELYAYEQNWVQVDGDGKYAKPLEDPGDAYARRMARGASDIPRPTATPTAAPARTNGATSGVAPADRTMPFGKTKGKRLGELAREQLESTLKWCREKDADKFKDLIASISAVLAARSLGEFGPEPEADDLSELDELPF